MRTIKNRHENVMQRKCMFQEKEDNNRKRELQNRIL